MSDVLEQIAAARVVPIVVIDDAEMAEPLGHAVLGAGMPIIEITLRTDASYESIKRLSSIDGLLVGAGTVLSIDNVKAALDAGASFMVTPGINADVITYCVENGIPIVPGIATATDIETVMKLGIFCAKVFPSEFLGGAPYVKALSGPYAMMKFFPTGGIRPEAIQGYLDLPCVVACGGSWMVKRDLIAAGEFDKIKQLTSEAVQLVQKV